MPVNPMNSVYRLLLLPAIPFLLTACATTITPPEETGQDKAPAVPFGDFDAVVLEEIGMGESCTERSNNEAARSRIGERLRARLSGVLPKLLGREADDVGLPENHLVVRPVIREIKFVSGSARFWWGALAGSSAVLMQVEYVDGRSRTVLACPFFYGRAAAMAGAGSWGVADNLMLDRIADDIVSFTEKYR